LRRVSEGATDLGLETLYFHFGRYLLIGSSRPGTMAANLQGIWNDQLAPSWDSKFTININTEMNYWPAEVCNLSELHEPLFDLIDNARADGDARADEDCSVGAGAHRARVSAERGGGKPGGSAAPDRSWVRPRVWPGGHRGARGAAIGCPPAAGLRL